MRRLFCLALFFLSVCSAKTLFAQEKLSHEDKLKIILSAKKWDPNYNKFVFYTSEMILAREQFRAAPEKFIKVIPLMYADYHEFELQEEEFLKIRSEELTNQINGGSLSDSMTFNSLRRMTQLLPFVGGPLSLALEEMGDRIRFSPNIPQIENLDVSELAGVLTDLGLSEDEEDRILADFLDTYSAKELGFKLNADLDAHPEVQRYYEMAEADDIDSHILKGIEGLDKKVELLLAKIQKEKDSETPARELIEAEYKELITSGMALFDSFSMIAQMLGFHEAATYVGKAGHFFNVAINLQKKFDLSQIPGSPSGISNILLTQNFLALGMAGANFFASPQKDPVIEHMQAIMGMIMQLSEEMHERFDIVDEKLDTIFTDIHWMFTVQQEQYTHVLEKFAGIEKDFKEIRAKIDDGQVAKTLQLMNDFDVNCLGIDQHFIEHPDPNLFKVQCLTPAVNYSSANITRKILNLDLNHISDIFWDDFEYPFLRYLPEIAHYARKYGNHPLYSEHFIDGLVHLDLWFENRSQTLNLE